MIDLLNTIGSLLPWAMILAVFATVADSFRKAARR